MIYILRGQNRSNYLPIFSYIIELIYKRVFYYMETKICTKCGKELSLEQFNWRNKSKGTRRSEGKFCHSGYMKDRYRQKKDRNSRLKNWYKVC